MLHSVEGIYRDGKVELKEKPADISEARVIVTFLPENGVDLRECGIDAALAAELRGRMQAFAEDWDRAEMDVYDDECAPSGGIQA